MKKFVEKLIEKISEITEPVRPVGWSRKIEIVETKAVIQIINELQEEYTGNLSENLTSSNNGWVLCEERYPDTKEYILLSFSNFSVPVVGRWEEDEEGGAFYVGDEMESCASQDLFVNAWQPLPEPYKPEQKEEQQKTIPTEHFYERFNKVI